METGLITANNKIVRNLFYKKVSIDYVLKGKKEEICHRVHRHESPVPLIHTNQGLGHSFKHNLR
jgi:hypothetical protein